MGLIQTILNRRLEREKQELRKLKYQRDVLSGVIENKKRQQVHLTKSESML